MPNNQQTEFKNDYPMVSVYCPTFNHAPFIEKALDSILMQKTSFDVEILVGEDCSTDGTREILKQYEHNHPNKIVVFYRDHNMNSEEVSNGLDLIRRCKGKYIVLLEGDDYWIDDRKLQKQVDFLEQNSDYLAVAHNCVVVDENSRPNGELFPECKDSNYTLLHYLSDIMPGQSTTLLFRNYYRTDLFDKSFVEKPFLQPGDRRLYFTLVANGKIFCIQEAMSAYRHIVNGGSSYSANIRRDFSKTLSWYENQLEYSEKIKNESAIRCAKLQYFLTVRSGFFHRDISYKQMKSLLKRVKGINKIRMLALRRDFNHYLFKKRIVLSRI